MLLLSDIKGQPNAIRYLKKSISSGRIAPSYLFSGPEGVGRALTAKAFIMTLFCGNKTKTCEACGVCPSCRKVDELNHPDVLWIKDIANTAIKIEEVRGIKSRLSLKPYEAPLNVCVVESAHMMTREASNAFLKMLEEPPDHSLIILTTHKKELLSETVISRCSDVRFHPLKLDLTRDIILKSLDGMDGKTAYFFAYFSQGSPGWALKLAGEKLRQRKDEVLSFIGSIIKEKNIECINWDRDDKDGLIEDIEMLIIFFRDITLAGEDLGKIVLDKGIIDTDMYRFFSGFSVEKKYRIVERLIEIKSALMGNVNPKLVAQVLPGVLR